MPTLPVSRPTMLAAAALLAFAGCGKSTRPEPNSNFELELIWLGTPPSSAVQATFDQAGNTIRATIVGALTTVAIPSDFTNLSQCGLPGYPDISKQNIRGLRIYAVVTNIDGVGGTLGSAGPCLIRGNNLPALGVMRFDAADVNNLLSQGRLTRVVLHEMLHVVGVGTVWDDQNLLDKTDTLNARFLGANARLECATTNGGDATCAATVPVHSADGDGSRFSHWRENVFSSELMTPFLGGGATPYSAMTIGSLEDLGYEVSYEPAEAYTVPTPPALMAGPASPGVQLGEPMRPQWKLDGAGRLTPYRPRR